MFVNEFEELKEDNMSSKPRFLHTKSKSLYDQQMDRMIRQLKRKKTSPGFLMVKRGAFTSNKMKNRRTTKKMIKNIDEMHRLTESQKKIKAETPEKNVEDEKLKKQGLKTHEEMRMDLISRGIAPEYEPAFQKHPVKKKVELNISDTRTFVVSPAPKDYGMIKCYIIRKRGKFNKLFPSYYLHHEKTDNFLLAAKKRTKTKTSSYLLSLDKDDMSRNSGNYFGKLRGNFVGTEFLMFDKGENPNNVSEEDDTQTSRNMMGAVKYEKNILGSQGPRKLTAILPKIESSGKYIKFFQKSDGPSLIDLYNQNSWDDLIILKNNRPQWNEELHSYVLNFNGRVKIASIKNFQIVDPKKPDKILAQFGRIGDDKFVLDFRYPFSAYITFCIALSACDSKLLCE